MAANDNNPNADFRNLATEVVERAIMTGVPFADLGAESFVHASAARALASDGQTWHSTLASVYHDSALEDGLFKAARKYGSPQTRAFLNGLIGGIPLFGSQPSTDGSTYAAISLEKLRFFRPGLIDLRDQIEYRVGRKSSATSDEKDGVEFAREFCEWIDEIADTGHDLWFEFD